MKSSINPNFISRNASAAKALARFKTAPVKETVSTLLSLPFDEALDYLQTRASRIVARGDAAQAVLRVEELCEFIVEAYPDDPAASDLRAALLSILTALEVERSRFDAALVAGAEALAILAASPKRKDIPFLTILGSLLFDLAWAHSERGEFRQAEREIEKSARVFQRLADIDAQRYSPAHLMAIDAATTIYRSSLRQANLLAHYQVATTTYMDMLANAKGDDAALRAATDGLVDSLATQSHTLMQMGRHREATPFLTRALKMLTKAEPELTPRSLELSVDLGEALCAGKATRDKGIHLLNTLLHKAARMGCDSQHRRISELLDNTRTDRLGILSIWYKIFPK